jgi:hypothetical protein
MIIDKITKTQLASTYYLSSIVTQNYLQFQQKNTIKSLLRAYDLKQTRNHNTQEAYETKFESNKPKNRAFHHLDITLN